VAGWVVCRLLNLQVLVSNPGEATFSMRNNRECRVIHSHLLRPTKKLSYFRVDKLAPASASAGG